MGPDQLQKTVAPPGEPERMPFGTYSNGCIMAVAKVIPDRLKANTPDPRRIAARPTVIDLGKSQ